NADRKTTPSKIVDERLRRRCCQGQGATGLGKRDDRSVLRDHGVHEAKVPRDAPEVIEDTAGHDEHDDAARAGIGERRAHLWLEHAIASDGSVVVEGENGESHSYIRPEPSRMLISLRRLEPPP